MGEAGPRRVPLLHAVEDLVGHRVLEPRLSDDRLARRRDPNQRQNSVTPAPRPRSHGTRSMPFSAKGAVSASTWAPGGADGGGRDRVTLGEDPGCSAASGPCGPRAGPRRTRPPVAAAGAASTCVPPLASASYSLSGVARPGRAGGVRVRRCRPISTRSHPLLFRGQLIRSARRELRRDWRGRRFAERALGAFPRPGSGRRRRRMPRAPPAASRDPSSPMPARARSQALSLWIRPAESFPA